MTLPRLLALFVGLAIAVHLYSNRGMHAGDPRQATGSDGVVMLSADWCGYCRALRADLERAAIPYRELDIDRDAEGARAYRALRARGVPVLVVGQDVIYGYDPRRALALAAAAGHGVAAP
jgi:glutaredoxin